MVHDVSVQFKCVINSRDLEIKDPVQLGRGECIIT